MPSATLTWTLATVAVAFTQAVGGGGLEDLKLPAWIVALAAAATLGARFVLYVREIAADKQGGGPVGTSADEREMLVLIRQGHDIQQRHLDELKLLRADLQQSRNAAQEMMAYLRRHDEEAAPTREKIHRLHDAYFEGDEG